MRVIAPAVTACLVAANLAAISPDQLPTRSATAGMWLMRPIDPQTGEIYGRMPGAFVRAARAKLDGLADMAMFGMAVQALRVTALSDDRRAVSVSEMTPGALALVGVLPIIGRDFNSEDLRRGAVIVTYRVWEGLLGARVEALGTPLWREKGAGQAREPVVIVGVLPRDFSIRVPVADPGAEAFIPSPVFTSTDANDGSFAPLVRLRPGVTIAAARTAVEAAVEAARKQIPEASKLSARLDPADRPGWMK